MMKKNNIFEQTNPCGNPTTVAEANGLGYVTTVPDDFSTSIYCFKIINGVSYYKRKDGKPIVPQQTVGGVNYTGFYKASKDFIGTFEISAENNKLYYKFKLGKTELTKKSENKFEGKILGVNYTIEFTVVNKEASGGKIITSLAGIITEVPFTRTTNAPEQIEEITWENVTRQAWERLKSLGYWVKEEGGKLLAAIRNGSPVVDDSAWDCINKWNEGWGYFKLLTGYEGDRKFLFEYTSHKVDGKKVKLLYFKDGEVLMKFTDSNQNVAGGTGKWSCTDSGYKIVWQNGQVAVFGNSKSLPATTQNGDSNTSNSETATSETPKFKEVCKSILPCPKRSDVEGGKASYKICMRCPEIAELQSNPVFKVIYFKKLKDRGFKESADGVFGPITKLAVEEYQEMNGLVKDGLIGQKTLAQLDKDKSGRK